MEKHGIYYGYIAENATDKKYSDLHYFKKEAGAGTAAQRHVNSSGKQGDMQSAIWKTFYNYEYARNAIGSYQPDYTCTCGDALYNNAKKDYSSGKYTYTVVIDVWNSRLRDDRGHQKFVHISYSKSEKGPKPVTLTFKKIDKSGNGIEGAKLSLSKGTNVESISKTNLDKSTKGVFDAITITPKTGNSGTFKIVLNEETTPKKYLGLPDDVILTVSYNKGSVTRNKCRNSKRQ